MSCKPSEIAVLFARRDSIYKTLPMVDVWDIDRDARGWPGGMPVISHPPCRGWGSLRKFSHADAEELALASFAVEQVRKFGGVLEHPRASKIWSSAHLASRNEEPDSYGGWILPIVQNWWGHRAEKETYLYIVGCRPCDIPLIPLSLAYASHFVVSCSKRRNGKRLRKGDWGWRPEISKAEREHTPLSLAIWLVELAQKCVQP